MRTVQVAEVIGATFRQLDYWSRLGLFGGSAQPGKGSGSQRSWSEAQVVMARALVLVASISHPAYQEFKGVEEMVQEALDTNRTLNGCWLIVSPEKVYVGAPFIGVGDAAVVVDLAACLKHVRAAAAIPA